MAAVCSQILPTSNSWRSGWNDLESPSVVWMESQSLAAPAPNLLRQEKDCLLGIAGLSHPLPFFIFARKGNNEPWRSLGQHWPVTARLVVEAEGTSVWRDCTHSSGNCGTDDFLSDNPNTWCSAAAWRYRFPSVSARQLLPWSMKWKFCPRNNLIEVCCCVPWINLATHKTSAHQR